MQSTLLPLYGPFAIHSFGVMIAVGLLVFTWFVQNHPKRPTLMNKDAFIDILLLGIFVGLVGARMLFLATHWHQIEHWTDIFTLWNGGLSVLGGILAILLIIPWALNTKKIPRLLFFDLIAIYAPLLQAIARLGCLCAGCCHGTLTKMPWGIIYTDSESIAPLGIPLHPAQLYSSLILLLIFLFMYFVAQNIFYRPGQLIAFYLILSGLERFSTDFFRGDQEFFASTIPYLQFFSIAQWIALGIITGGSILFICVSHQKQPSLHTS